MILWRVLRAPWLAISVAFYLASLGGVFSPGSYEVTLGVVMKIPIPVNEFFCEPCLFQMPSVEILFQTSGAMFSVSILSVNNKRSSLLATREDPILSTVCGGLLLPARPGRNPVMCLLPGINRPALSARSHESAGAALGFPEQRCFLPCSF